MGLLILLIVLGVYLDHALTQAAARREQRQVHRDLQHSRHVPRAQVIRDHYTRHPRDSRAPKKEGRP